MAPVFAEEGEDVAQGVALGDRAVNIADTDDAVVRPGVVERCRYSYSYYYSYYSGCCCHLVTPTLHTNTHSPVCSSSAGLLPLRAPHKVERIHNNHLLGRTARGASPDKDAAGDLDLAVELGVHDKADLVHPILEAELGELLLGGPQTLLQHAKCGLRDDKINK